LNATKPIPVTEPLINPHPVQIVVSDPTPPVFFTENKTEVEVESKTDELDRLITEIEFKDESETLVLAEYISSKYKTTVEFAKRVVDLATKYAHEDFPKRNDILAIIAVESSFRPKASYRGSYGLMQIERKSHTKSLRGRNIKDPAVNIELGSQILNEYYQTLGQSKKSAILAYNAGVGNFLKHRYHIDYYLKYSNKVSGISKN
jgi:soluble lytic murein transglycosylase-like protein